MSSRVLPLITVLAISLCPIVSASEIHDAARDGDLKTVRTLLETDPTLVNARDARSMTPLHHASRGVHPQVVTYLVAHGADVSATDANQVTPLHSLAYRGATELVELMITKGADVDAAFSGGRTALHLAVSDGHTSVVEVLLANGADADITDAMGNTPLLLVSADGSKDMVALLIDGGAAVDHRHSRGDTAITVAHREGHTEIVELLASKGADAGRIKEIPALDGPHLGQKPPGTTPAIFAPGSVSTERDQLNAVFSPDGREFYFTQVTSAGSVIMEMRLAEGGWSRPQPASFSGGFRDVDHFMTRDGERMFFCSLRPVDPEGEPRQDADFWVAHRSGKGWTEPERLEGPVNSDNDDYYPTLTDDGALVFSSRRKGGLGGSDIYLSRSKDGAFADPVNLGPTINTEHTEFDPFVAPDASYIIFSSDRPGGYGSGDLYISFADADGSWTEARNMGPELNSDGRDFTPMLSPNGRYLFFTSTKAGSGDLYWVDAKVIEAFRPHQPRVIPCPDP